MVQPFRSVDFSILVPEGQRTIWYNGQAFLSGRHSWLHLPPTCCPAGQTLILNVAGHMSVPPPELHTSAIFARVSVPAMPNAGSPCSCWNFTRYRCVWPPTDDTGTTASFCPNLTMTLTRGMKDATTNGQVTELQQFLADQFDLADSFPSGFFGGQTQRYLVKFQQEHGLPAFGIAGTLTRAKIAEVCSSGGGTDICPATLSIRVCPAGQHVGGKCNQECLPDKKACPLY
jgi:hypothetical protein